MALENVGGVQATLGLDYSGFKKGMEEAKAGMKAAVDQSKKFNQDFKGISKSLRDAGVDSKEIRKIKTELLALKPDVVEKQLANVDKQLKSMGASSEHIARVKKQMQGVAEQTQEAGEEAKKSGDKFDNLAGVIGTIGAGAALTGLIRTVKSLSDEAQQLTNSFKGLTEVSKAVGQNTGEVQKAVDDLVSRGFMTATEAAEAFKTSLAAGYDLQESIKLINALSDAAAYNRESHLDWGEAVVNAIRGIKMQESALTDSAGITTNLSVMYERYAATIGKSAAKLTDAEKMQAAYNGMMQEAALFAGNADTAMEGYAGTQAYFNQTIQSARVELGEAFIPVINEIMQKIGPLIKDFAVWAEENKEVIVGITAGAAAVLGLITVLGTLTIAIGAVTAALRAMNVAMGPIGWAITALSLVAAGVTAYKIASDAAAGSILQFAENQELLNQKLDESPASRTVEDVKKLQGDIETLNEIIEQRVELEEQLNTLIENDPRAANYAKYGVGMDVKEVRDLKNEIGDLDDKLRSMDFANVDEAGEALKRMRSEAEKSTPALMQMAKAELQDVAAKNSKILEMEKMVARYKTLDAAQKIDESQKQELIQITNTLKSQYPGLHAMMDEEGRIRIENINSVSDQIGVEKSLLSTSVEAAKGQINNIKNVTNVQKSAVEAQIKNYQQLANVMGQISGKMLKIGVGKTDPKASSAKRVGAMVAGLVTGGLAGKAQEEITKRTEEQVKLAATEIEADRALANLTSGNFDAFSYKAPDYGSGSSGAADSKKKKTGSTKKEKTGKSAAEIAKDLRKDAYDAAMATARYNAEYYDQTADQQLKALEKIKKNHKQHLKETVADQRELNLQMKRLQEDTTKSNFEASATWIDRQERRMEDSYKSEVQIAQMKVDSWTRLRNKYKKDSEFYKEADEQLYKARKDLTQAQFDASAEWIDMEERRMEDSGKTEKQIAEMKLAAWTRVRDRYKKESAEYKRADEEVYRARKSLVQDLQKETQDFFNTQKKSVETSLKTELDAIEARKQAYVDEQDAKIKAIDELIKKEQERNNDIDYETELAEKIARKEKLSTAVSPEGRKALADITAEIERMQLEHSRELRKRDLESQKETLEEQKGEQEKAYDQEKDAAEARYEALKDAFDNYSDDVKIIEEAIKNFRIGANEQANQAILSDLDNFLAQYKVKMSSISSVSGIPNQSLDLQEYNANKDAWSAAKARGDSTEMARLAARNEQLRHMYGINKDTGKLESFDVGGIVPGAPGEPRHIIAHGGEAIFNTQHLNNLFRLLEVPRIVPSYDRAQGAAQYITNHIDMSVHDVELTDGADIATLYDERERVARRLQTKGVK